MCFSSCCGKSYRNRNQYEDCQRKCSGDLLACAFCPKKFWNKRRLVCHERLHTGDRPYACPLCKSTYTREERS